jgi:dTDP-4-dehydrorhamnose reductase
MIVLLGGKGYMGTAFQRYLRRMDYPYHVVSRNDVDCSQLNPLRDYLKGNNVEFLINTAGYAGRPNVDACELHKTQCLHENAVLPGVVRAVCEELQLPWGHVSSGCIYTGTRADGNGFTEDDPPNFSFRQDNCNFYSGCKALGEELLSGAESCFIWRLRVPFNEIDAPRNYISKLIKYDRLLDVTNSLSQLDEMVRACVTCWTKRIPFGTYNLTNPGSVTTREVVEMIRHHGLSHKVFSFFKSEEEFMKIAAKTPRSNCILDSSKATSAGLVLSPVHDALDAALRQWRPECS